MKVPYTVIQKKSCMTSISVTRAVPLTFRDDNFIQRTLEVRRSNAGNKFSMIAPVFTFRDDNFESQRTNSDKSKDLINKPTKESSSFQKKQSKLSETCHGIGS